MYFSKISTCIENEGISGILLNKLHYASDSGLLLIDKDEKQDPNYQTFRYDLDNPSVSFKDLFEHYRAKNLDMRNLKLCPDLNTFRFIGWNLETEVNSRQDNDI